jgi:hypothetical protein
MSPPGTGDDGMNLSVSGSVPPRFTSNADRLTYLLVKYRAALVLAAAAATVLFVTGRFNVPELPPQVGLALQGFALGIVPATLLGKILVVDRYMSSDELRVAVVDPRDGGVVDAWNVPPQLWEDRRRGESPAMKLNGTGADWAVTELEYLDDVDELAVEGVNPELADPISIIARDGKLDEIYTELLDTARRYTRLKATAQSKAQQIEKANANALLAAHEYSTSFNPGDTGKIVDEDAWSEHSPTADDKDPARSDDPSERAAVELDMSEALDELAGRNDATTNGDGRTETPEP